MEELVGVVKLIIQMESAIAADDDSQNGHHRAPHHHHHRKSHKHGKHRKDPREPPNIQRWISRRCKRDILFLLASISGVKMKIYSLPTEGSAKREPVCKERVCRVSMDGKYLSMGSDCIALDRRLEVSLGLDMCYKDVCAVLKQLGLYRYYTQCAAHDLSPPSAPSTGSSSISSAYHSSSTATTASSSEDIVRTGRLRHGLSASGRLKPKHCLTIHDPDTRRTLILQLPNCRDRTMWAKGLCGLKHLTQKARNFRWTVVAYLISKYASTLNAHSQQNLSHPKGLKGVSKGLNALRMGLKSAKGSRPKMASNPMNTPCYFEPFAQLIKVIGAQGHHGLNPKYPRRFHEMNRRREQRLRNHKSNYSQFGENDLMYDPNKVEAKPEDADVYYE